jgi:hypothetical protein
MPLQSARGGWRAVFALALLLFAADPAFSQSPPPGPFAPPAQQPSPQGIPSQAAPPQAAPSQAAPPPAATPEPEAQRKPNMFEATGRWWDKSAADFKQGVEENNAKWKRSVDEQNAKWRELNAKTEQAARDAAASSAAAAEAFKNLSAVKLVEGRQVCEIAANGAPDCQTAAEVFCKGKGFTTGKSADITTTRKCKAASLFRRETHECKVETVMIKAACQ